MHKKFMQIALNLAGRGVGQTWPNPSVGCVIVKNGEIISRAVTAKRGRPHAEVIALKEAGKKAEGADIYITLEPCAHKINSCTNLLIKAKPARVIIATVDPDKRTNGKGIKALEQAGIKVILEVLEREARELNKGFFTRVKKHRPFVTLKVAISSDNKFMEAKAGNIQWTTGKLARDYVHMMRAQHDAILCGSRTVIDDNPQYTCRLPGLEKSSPRRILIDRKLTVPFDYNLYNNPPLIVFSEKKSKLPKGAELIYAPKLELEFVLEALAEKGITRLMVETGPMLANAFLDKDLVDEVAIFVAPAKLGKSGRVYFEKPIEGKFCLVQTRDFYEDKFLLLKRK